MHLNCLLFELFPISTKDLITLNTNTNEIYHMQQFVIGQDHTILTTSPISIFIRNRLFTSRVNTKHLVKDSATSDVSDVSVYSLRHHAMATA